MKKIAKVVAAAKATKSTAIAPKTITLVSFTALLAFALGLFFLTMNKISQLDTNMLNVSTGKAQFQALLDKRALNKGVSKGDKFTTSDAAVKGGKKWRKLNPEDNIVYACNKSSSVLMRARVENTFITKEVIPNHCQRFSYIPNANPKPAIQVSVWDLKGNLIRNEPVQGFEGGSWILYINEEGLLKREANLDLLKG